MVWQEKNYNLSKLNWIVIPVNIHTDKFNNCQRKKEQYIDVKLIMK